MRFLIILACLATERYLGIGPVLRCYDGLYRYFRFVCRALDKTPLWKSWLGILVILLPILFLVWVIQMLFVGQLHGLLSFLFGTAVLLYCLSPLDFRGKYLAYLQAREEQNQDKLDVALSDILGQKERISDENEQHRTMAHTFLSAPSEGVFSVLFWFFICGPVGAVLYRLALLLRDFSSTGESIYFHRRLSLLVDFLSWAPSRLVAISYALAGDFIGGFGYWCENAWSGLENNREILIYSGLSALDLDEKEVVFEAEAGEAAIGLVERTLIIWLFVFGLLTFAAWIL